MCMLKCETFVSTLNIEVIPAPSPPPPHPPAPPAHHAPCFNSQ